jgi:F-type H+-transporting ATPase subunit epsilon
MTIKVEIVTAERVVFSGDVDMVLAPGIEGELGILPHHAPLMTTLVPGTLTARKSGEDFTLAISGGFLEVRPERVIILADSAERAEEIDIARAEEAKKRAQEQLAHPISQLVAGQAEASLRRALARIQAVDKVKRKKLNQSR